MDFLKGKALWTNCTSPPNTTKRVGFFLALVCCCILACYSYMGTREAITSPQTESLGPKMCDRILYDACLPLTEKPWFVTPGCKVHRYNQSEAKKCMLDIAEQFGKNTIVLLGDSRIRALFISLSDFLGRPHTKIPVPMRHTDFSYHNPHINTTVMYKFRGKMNRTNLEDYLMWEKTSAKSRPNIIVQGQSLWDLTLSGPFETSSKYFRGNLTRIVPHMQAVAATTDILWMIQDPPNAEKLSKADVHLRGPKRIDSYNNITIEILSGTPVKLWHSARETALRFPHMSDKAGFHYAPAVIDYKIQLFLNYYCNRHMDYGREACCTRQTKLQPATANRRALPHETGYVYKCDVGKM